MWMTWWVRRVIDASAVAPSTSFIMKSLIAQFSPIDKLKNSTLLMQTVNEAYTNKFFCFTIPDSRCLFFGFLYPKDSLFTNFRLLLCCASISYLKAHQFLKRAKNSFVFTTLISAANKTTFIDIPRKKWLKIRVVSLFTFLSCHT